MSDIDLEQALLAIVRQPNFKPAKPRALAKQLRLDEDGARELKRVIKLLVKTGQLVFGANHLVGPPAASKEGYRVTGVFRRAAAGFGFVRPAGSAPGSDRRHDIFVAADSSRDAATGDTVLVRLKRGHNRRGNPEGEVVEIIERETHRFVGVYFEAGGMGMVQVDGKAFTQAVSVGDPGAKNAQPDDKVVIEMVRFPTHAHGGEAVITEVLGPRGQPGIDTLSIIREFNLPDEFAADALDEARAQADVFEEEIEVFESNGRRGRTDLTALTIITIDPIDARDFDDAISLEKTPEGHWRLGVHIADVSHFVRPKTAIDREALARATSVYLPDRVLPMLPEIISNGLASLQPDRVRYTKTAFIEFTPDGVPVHTELVTGAIKSRRRFTYEEVDDFLAHRDAWRAKLNHEVHALLGRMHELAMILRKRRMRRGSLELSLEEVKVDLDKHGRVTGAHVVKNTESHQIIEEFMLAANEAVARKLADAGLEFLRRVHEAPDPRKLKVLTEFVAGLGLRTESLESRFALQKLLGDVLELPQRHAVHYAALRSLQRAIYSPQKDGHYALASDCYTHFTSPIRRYPDLTIHRLIDALLSSKKPRSDFGELAVLGEHCSERERRAEEAERELTKIKLLEYLSTRVGETMNALVTGVEEFGLFVQGIEIPAEGLIHVTSLQDDYYRFDRAAHTLSGHRSGNLYRLGDFVTVSVARVDIDRRELDFRLVGRGGVKAPAARRDRTAPVQRVEPEPRTGQGAAKRRTKTARREHRAGGSPGKKKRRK